MKASDITSTATTKMHPGPPVVQSTILGNMTSPHSSSDSAYVGEDHPLLRCSGPALITLAPAFPQLF